LEKVSKLDRYSEAAVGKAEQAAKIAYAFEHLEYSTGENPLSDVVSNKRFRGISTPSESASSQVLADGLANRIMETTSNQAWNLPNGVSLKSFGTDIETEFGAFYKAVFEAICSAAGIPPEVAMQSFNSNYSASRAALNIWAFNIDILRKKFADDFYIPFYSFWLEWEILNNKIDAPGYLEAAKTDNFMVIDSYTQCRFTGKNMPHIDPLKEVNAVRAMLGKDDNVALISREQATEYINAGNWNDNYLKNLEEEKIIEEDDTTNDNTEEDATV
jgi:capsid protein